MAHRKNLPATACVANLQADGRLNAPSALRNAEPIIELVREIAIKSGNALEIASGSGQHIVKLAAALPLLNWQPSDVDETRIKSIRCWSNDHHLTNLNPPCLLDATKEGWATEYHGQDLILLVNLLHLISIEETKILVKEVSKALAPKGVSIIYGPFMRSGELISKSDMEFHHSLINTDPDLGYKNDVDMLNLFGEAGLVHLSTNKMPANNLAFITQKR
ncbi:class I SAM-dependent methyltransferase [Paracoccaceae bacterium]|nr:class I SAM-dependent methyltransferase [Paracoccaceae bacterium]